MEFNFLKYLFENDNTNFLKYFESDLSEYFYSHHIGYSNTKTKRNKKETILEMVKFLLGKTNDILIHPLKNKGTIISDSYFTINDELRKYGYKVAKSPWVLDKKNPIIFSYLLYKQHRELYKNIYSGLNNTLCDDFISSMNDFQKNLGKFLDKIESPALILPSDTSFSQKMLIEYYKKRNKPSFLYLHGIPGTFKPYRFNSTDYLLVWGNKLKENYVKNGLDSSKILVVGHPYYKEMPKNKSLRFSFDNVLVLSKSILGAQKNNGKIALQDRANSLLYLYLLKDILMSMGVKSVHLRLHPSENKAWYKRNIDTSFFAIEKKNLAEALTEASLVIGPRSTVFVEALYYGVNYVLFDPVVDNKDMNSIDIASPLNESNAKLPYATNIEDLKYILNAKIKIDPSVLGDYIKTPFNLNEVISIIDKTR